MSNSNNKNTLSESFSVSRRKFLATTSTLAFGAPGILTSKNKTTETNEIDPDYFVLIADTHIDENPHQLHHDSNMFDNLEVTVNRILNNDKYGKPNGVFVLGDIGNTKGLLGEYALSWKMLRHLTNAGILVNFAMGDQDNRANFYKAFPDQLPETTFIRHRHIEIIDSPNAYHIILDTLATRAGDYVKWGELGDFQRNWLDETLETYNDKPVMLHGHHYPWPNEQSDGSISGLKDHEEFLEVVHSHHHVKFYIFGHSHKFAISSDNGLHLLNVPTIAGHSGNQPVGFIHAFFYPDKMRHEIECIDTDEPWHGDSGTLEYRADATSSEGEKQLPSTIQLHQNHPNPFNSSTNISYSLPQSNHVSLEIYTTDGRLVDRLVNTFKSAGQHDVNFDASRLASGTYVYRLKAGGDVLTRKMILIK